MYINIMHFPFTAVEGNEPLKLALILNIINPKIGGVLINGEKGSAKSTLARATAQIANLDETKFITLPLGCSTDMLVGSLSLEKVLNEKQVAFQPGLLAKAHQGILYVDEVNLLPDHLVDQLLDVATSKTNKIERDGISHEHESDFILLGTMNPDEGQLRAQLLDRFALQVDLSPMHNAKQRVNIIKKTQAYFDEPEQFINKYKDSQQILKTKIQTAKELLPNVIISDELLLEIANICIEAQVEGLRADIILNQSAKAHAAWLNKTQVELSDILAVKEFVLLHRSKNQSEQSQNNSEKKDDQQTESNNKSSNDNSDKDKSNKDKNESEQQSQTDGEDWGSMTKKSHEEIIHQTLTIPDTNNIQIKKKDKHNITSDYGHETINKISWIDSFKKNKGTNTETLKDNLVLKPNQSKPEILHMILMDTSASTLQSKTLGKSKGVIHAIANQAYLAREEICIHEFGTSVFEQALNKIKSPKDIEPFLKTIKAGGGTPLVQSIIQLKIWQKKLLKQSPNLCIFTYLLSDGRTNENIDVITPIENMVVIDLDHSNQKIVKRSKCESIAKALNAQYISL